MARTKRAVPSTITNHQCVLLPLMISTFILNKDYSKHYVSDSAEGLYNISGVITVTNINGKKINYRSH